LATFTLILEFGGGTYIRQVRATSPQGALKKLAASNDGKVKLFHALADNGVVAIDGLENCWCSTASRRGKFALINIVRTAE
jgi:hypothetical protein